MSSYAYQQETYRIQNKPENLGFDYGYEPIPAFSTSPQSRWPITRWELLKVITPEDCGIYATRSS